MFYVIGSDNLVQGYEALTLTPHTLRFISCSAQSCCSPVEQQKCVQFTLCPRGGGTLKNVGLFIEAAAQHGLASFSSASLNVSWDILGFPVNQVKAEQILKIFQHAAEGRVQYRRAASEDTHHDRVNTCPSSIH